jgi:hypothetical protein
VESDKLLKAEGKHHQGKLVLQLTSWTRLQQPEQRWLSARTACAPCPRHLSESLSCNSSKQPDESSRQNDVSTEIVHGQCQSHLNFNDTGDEKPRCRVPVPTGILPHGRCGARITTPLADKVQQQVAVRRSNVSRIADHADNLQVGGPMPVAAHITVPTPCACNFSGICGPFLVSHSQSFSLNSSLVPPKLQHRDVTLHPFICHLFLRVSKMPFQGVVLHTETQAMTLLLLSLLLFLNVVLVALSLFQCSILLSVEQRGV